MRQSKPSPSTRGTCQNSVRIILIMLALVSITFIHAQSTPALRKLVYKVAPKYPRELKQNAIGGVVRLSISINPNGSVGKVSPIGGNPILVDSATLAVKQWKYLPADHSSTTEVQLDFIPGQQ